MLAGNFSPMPSAAPTVVPKYGLIAPRSWEKIKSNCFTLVKNVGGSLPAKLLLKFPQAVILPAAVVIAVRAVGVGEAVAVVVLAAVVVLVEVVRVGVGKKLHPIRINSCY